jgi:hypothetical protein
MEMNLVTDRVPFLDRVKDGTAVELPAAFFVDPRLSGESKGVPVDLKTYQGVLRKVGSAFAVKETPGLVESRHAFNVPARSYIDNRALDALVKQGVLDEELIAAVLAIDFTTPVYSKRRAGLLKYVPETARDAADLRKKLVEALGQAKDDPAARELLTYLTDKKYNAQAHRERARAYLEACRKVAGDSDAVRDWWRVASQRRLELDRAETSRSPRGKITEPGFRVIFPQDTLGSTPGRLRLNPRTARCED